MGEKNKLVKDYEEKEYNKENIRLLNAYLKNCEERNLSKETIRVDKWNTISFLTFILEKENNVPFYKLERGYLDRYSKWLSENKISETRINILSRVARKVLKFAQNNEDFDGLMSKRKLPKTKVIKVSRSKVEIEDCEHLTMEQIDWLFNTLIKEKRYKEALLLALVVDGCCSRLLVHSLKKTDINLDNYFTNEIKLRDGRTRRIMYGNMTKLAYKLYMSENPNPYGEELWILKRDSQNIGKKETVLFAGKWVKSWSEMLTYKFDKNIRVNVCSIRKSSLALLKDGTHYACNRIGRGLNEEELKIFTNWVLPKEETSKYYNYPSVEEALLDIFKLN